MGVQIPSEPITRKEQYLAKIAGQAVEIPAEPITREEAYLAAIAKGGGGGGTGDYNDLINQPQIGGNILVGNKSASDLGLASKEDLAGKQNALTAGLYIEFDGNEISVKRDITQTAQQIEYNFTIPSDYTLRVKKYLNGDLVDTTDYTWNSVTDPINLDSIMEVSKKAGGGFYWVVKNLIASTTQAANYSVELYAFQTSTNYTQNFVATIDADKKLIIQSELDAALAYKADKTDVKNEFIGTLAQWEELSPAQKKEYDTYQIPDDYSEALMPNYSTVEQKTGQKWIDGRDIYVKTYNAGALPSSGNVTIQNDIANFGAVINVITTGISNDGYSFSNDGLVMNYASASAFVFRVAFDATGYNGYVTVYYVKTA